MMEYIGFIIMGILATACILAQLPKGSNPKRGDFINN